MKANDTKPIIVDTIDKGENKVCEIVMPMMNDAAVTLRSVRGDDWVLPRNAANDCGATRMSYLEIVNARTICGYCTTAAHVVF